MVKLTNPAKDVERRAAEALRSLLEQVPTIRMAPLRQELSRQEQSIDLVADIEVADRHYALVCEVKSSGEPRLVRTGILQLQSYVSRHAPNATPVLIAPYLSPDAQALCRDERVCFLDFEGNAWLVFDSVYVDRQVANKPSAERRGLRSLFKAKSARVLRVMLRAPYRAWRVIELAKAAQVSLGHVSQIRARLLDREWATVSNDGLFLSRPDALLDHWRAAYEPPVGARLAFYTTRHGRDLEDAARLALSSDGGNGVAVFASFSAAQWIAPYGRSGLHYFYADEKGAERLRANLRLSDVSKGDNVHVTIPKDSGVFLDTVEPAPGAICTSPVQTYLDLAAAGERGREAADYLRQHSLAWQQ